MTRSSIELAIADRVQADEARMLAILGHDRIDIGLMAFGAHCGVMLIATAEDRPAVWPRTDTTVTGKR